MKTRIASFAAILSAVFLLGCGGGKDESGETISGNYKLEIVDSLQFDILSRSLWIVDVDSINGDMLVIQPSNPPKAWLFDKYLNILEEFEKPDGDPEGTGEYITSGAFFDGGIALMGRHILNIYDRNFGLKKSLRPHFSPSSLVYVGFKNLFEFRDQVGNPQLATYFGKPQLDIFGDKPEFYEQFNLIDVVNPALSNSSKDTVFIPFGELTPNSRYLKGKAFHFLRPKFDVKENKLYYALNDDTTFFVRSLPNGDILESYTIPFDKYILSQGYSFGIKAVAEQNEKRDRPGQIENVFHSNGFDVVVYNSGLKMSEMAVYEGSEDFYERLAHLDYKKYLILKNGVRLNEELKLDERVYYVQFADNEGNLYASQDSRVLDEEPEKYTIYKMRIVEDN
ncbi:MAG: hypothetical protein HWE21_13920 [Cytophagia bacterium]|nr:hypothetical protein [Cytophagia bacterium]